MFGTALHLTTCNVFEPRHEHEVILDAHFGVEWRSFGKITDAFLHLERLFENVEAGDSRFAGTWRQEARQNSHGGCFTGSIWTEKTNDVTFLDRKRNLVDGNVTCVFLG